MVAADVAADAYADAYAEVHVTCSGAAEADAIATALVEERLAACVQAVPVTSVYRWKGSVERDVEVLLVVKTTAARAPAAAARIAELHSYELPAITWTTGAATPATMAWLTAP